MSIKSENGLVTRGNCKGLITIKIAERRVSAFDDIKHNGCRNSYDNDDDGGGST